MAQRLLTLWNKATSFARIYNPLTTPSQQTPHKPNHFDGIFTLPPHDPPAKPSKDEDKKIKSILERLRHYGIDNIAEANVEYALHAQSSHGDPEAAFKMLMMLEDTYEGIIRPYDPNVKLTGAVNREATTCYLDALLFAMFARLDSFEAMLYENFDDAKRKRLAGLLRLWVNMLRTGRLITVDLTEQIQHALSDCGWRDARRIRQQDPSEAFTFITGELELPMLTLKMDMYHTGKEDPQDDHKFINERLLEVALPDEPPEGREVLTLEDCLEHYFNNRIEVKRHMEMQRRNTLKSASLADSATKVEKGTGTHVEVVELNGPDTPVTQSPAILTPAVDIPSFPSSFPPSSVENLRPTLGRKRGDSIFSQRKIELIGIDPNELKPVDTNFSLDSKGRKLSTRTEVLMPAWQFFKLLPWYTDHMPESDAQVAAHFSKKRPVLGIALKRYSYTNTGQARRLDTYVDIPLEIAVPNFVSDDGMAEEGPLVGNFRLALQSVVCHRGVSVHSGHYVCLARGRIGTVLRTGEERRGSHDSTDEDDDPWMRFDDLAPQRVTPVDIHEALKKETPYLLFYQVLPIGEDGHEQHDLPSYTEATSHSPSDAILVEKPFLHEPADISTTQLERVVSEPTPAVRGSSTASTEILDFVPVPAAPASERTSLDERGRTNLIPLPTDGPEARRKSITFDTSSASGSIRTATDYGSVPTTPSEEKGNAFLNVAKSLSGSRRVGRGAKKDKEGSRSRPTSMGPRESENGGGGGGGSGSGRFSLDLRRLTQRVSSNSNGKEKAEGVGMEEHVPVIAPSEKVAAGETDALPPADSNAGEQTAKSTAGLPTSDKNVSKESVGPAPPYANAPTAAASVPVPARVPVPVPSSAAHGHGSGKLRKEKEKEREKEKKLSKKSQKAGGAHEERDCVVM
jgi:hypothetical protein